jgi:DNA-binding transcriptional LysR family regulator
MIDLIDARVDLAVRIGRLTDSNSVAAAIGEASMPRVRSRIGRIRPQPDLAPLLPQWASAPITAWAVHRAELRGAPRLRAFIAALPKSAAELNQ